MPPMATVDAAIETQFESFRAQLDDSGTLRERIRNVATEIESVTRLDDSGTLRERIRNIATAEGLVSAQQELGQTMGELGLMFMKLVKFENQEAVLETQRRRVNDMKNVATSTIKTSRLYRSLELVEVYYGRT